MPRSLEQMKIEKSRAKSDEKLIRGGAGIEVGEEGERHLATTDEQIENIKFEEEKRIKRAEILDLLLTAAAGYKGWGSDRVLKPVEVEKKEDESLKLVKEYFLTYYNSDIEADIKGKEIPDKKQIQKILANIDYQCTVKKNSQETPLKDAVKEVQDAFSNMALGGFYHNDPWHHDTAQDFAHQLFIDLKNEDPETFDEVSKLIIDRIFTEAIKGSGEDWEKLGINKPLDVFSKTGHNVGGNSKGKWIESGDWIGLRGEIYQILDKRNKQSK